MSTTSQVASQRIADVLAARILDGTLAPGSRIKQDQLADELSTSRIPVREALRILETRGLVTLRANSGAWVMSLSLPDLEMSYEIRERIEPLLLADSIPRLTDEHVARMRELQAEIVANDDVERFLVLDREFHEISYAGSEATHLAGMVRGLWDTTQPYRRAFVRQAGTQESWVIAAEHDLILDAVARRDVDIATRMLTVHIRRTRLALLEHPEVIEQSMAPSGGAPQSVESAASSRGR
ncbi:GntR family transcriptional regulator [Pimelobacter simplex]|uniref:GntR family transcriptional regulator n=1 Tax=Nocardioides simplex TaxID=2045 RepID=UPI0037FDAC99